MTLLILGLALWYAAHFFKRALPDVRAGLGDRGKGLVALAIVASVVLMVIGFKRADYVDIWYPPVWAVHLNNLMVLFAFYFTSPGPSKGALFYKMRHPMLTGFLIWTAAHLLVNGDVAAIILFGGLAVWAVLEIIVINASDKEWQPNPKGRIAKDGMFFAISILLVLVVGFIHGLVGPSPFAGG